MQTDPLDHSRETRHMLTNHIQLTDVKMQSLVEGQARLESAIKWAGGLLVSLILTVLGWALVQQYNANEAQKKDMQQQLDLLRAQEALRLQSAASASQPAVAPRSVGQ